MTFFVIQRGKYKLTDSTLCVAFNFSTLPVSHCPGIKAADSLVGNISQVGIACFPVPPDVSQHAAWHGDNSPPAWLRWAWECGAASELLCILGYVLRQAVVGDHTVCEETKEDGYLPSHTGRFPQCFFVTF